MSQIPPTLPITRRRALLHHTSSVASGQTVTYLQTSQGNFGSTNALNEKNSKNLTVRFLELSKKEAPGVKPGAFCCVRCDRSLAH
jgi:hypothetical protein